MLLDIRHLGGILLGNCSSGRRFLGRYLLGLRFLEPEFADLGWVPVGFPCLLVGPDRSPASAAYIR